MRDMLLSEVKKICAKQFGCRDCEFGKVISTRDESYSACLLKGQSPWEWGRIDDTPAFGKWIPCRERLPRVGEDVILYFRDTYHTDPSWPETQFLPAWRCNVAEEDTPNGQWAIEGRLWNTVVIDIEDGIAWMPMPKFEE